MACRKMNEDVAYAHNTESGCKLSSILRFCSLLDIWWSCSCCTCTIWLQTKGPGNQAFILSSPVFTNTQTPSCVNFFLPDRPTHLHEREGNGKRNMLLGWPYQASQKTELYLISGLKRSCLWVVFGQFWTILFVSFFQGLFDYIIDMIDSS